MKAFFIVLAAYLVAMGLIKANPSLWWAFLIPAVPFAFILCGGIVSRRKDSAQIRKDKLK